MKKITFLERGRLDDLSMKSITGGESDGTDSCSNSGPICPKVGGAGFTVVRDCAHNLLTCDLNFKVCNDRLSFCPGDDGGDFLIYPYWYEVLKKMSECGFHPTISTKTPLTKEKVDKLISANVKKIQLSLDSVVNEEIIKILSVNEHYLENVIEGIELLNNAHIQIILKPVITNINDSVDSIEKLISFASKYEMISDIYLTPADYSQFKPFTYHSSKSQLNILREKINYWKGLSKKNVFLLGYGEPIPQKQKEETFKKRSACSGNMNAFFVLPDGKVTLCEQLYWHPFFILGDLSKQSILEMWNSPKALSLWNISQKDIQDGSPCRNCEDFEECRRGLGNCWRLAVESYGNDYYDYPAPNCPKSPTVTKDMFIK